MERDGTFHLSSHNGLFVSTEPMQDILAALSCPIFSSPPFRVFLVVLFLRETNQCWCPLHYLGHLLRLSILHIIPAFEKTCATCALQHALPALLQRRCRQQAPEHGYFDEQEPGFPPRSRSGLLKGFPSHSSCTPF